jgi:1,4-alpha-glucan branching enzyme
MLYRDYSRKAGEWVPTHGGRENLEAVDFLRTSTAVPTAARRHHDRRGIHRLARRLAPAEEGGLGFGFKWNMGWMHDTLHYMEQDPVTEATTTTT